MYYVFEGFDGSGKSSVIIKLMQELGQRGIHNNKLVNYMAPVPMWISIENLVEQISNTLSAHTDNSIRAFRYEIQYEHFISPLLELGINVFGDRGPASLAYRNGYRLGTVPNSYLDMISLPDFYFVMDTDPIKCYERITSIRKLNRVERNFRDSADQQDELNDFLSDYHEFQLFLNEILPKDKTFHVDNNQSVDETANKLMEFIMNTSEVKSKHLSNKISLSKKAVTTSYLLADLISNDENHLAGQLKISDISSRINQLKAGSPSLLENYLAWIIATGRTDIKDIVVNLVHEFPYLCRVIASVISKNPELITTDLLRKILVDEKARSIFICQMGTNMIELPTFDEIFVLLASELDMKISYVLTLYIKGVEKKKFELLSRGSLLFHSDPFISFFAVQAWVSAGLIQYLPPSFKEHNVIEVMHLLQIHKLGENSKNLLVASPIDNVFTYDIKAVDQRPSIDEILCFIAKNYEWVNIVLWVSEKLSSSDNRIYFKSEHNDWTENRFKYSLIDLSQFCIIVGKHGVIAEFILNVGEWSTIPPGRIAH